MIKEDLGSCNTDDVQKEPKHMLVLIFLLH